MTDRIDFLSFVYQGATRTRNGDNLEAGLVLSCNRISSGYAQKILEGHAVTITAKPPSSRIKSLFGLA